MVSYIQVLLVALSLLSTTTVSAESIRSAPFVAFAKVQQVSPVEVIVPTVVEIPLSDTTRTGYAEFAVLENETKQYIPYYVLNRYIKNPVSVRAESGMTTDYALTDKNTKTSVDYLLQEERTNTVSIQLTSEEKIKSSGVVLGLDQYVALPTQVSIQAVVEGVGTVLVLAPQTPQSNRITFPQTNSDTWTVTLTYAQPLRIHEIELVQDDVAESSTRSIRFLAQPNYSYSIYADPDRPQQITTLEQGNLTDDRNVKVLPGGAMVANGAYVQADTDADGIPDMRDNCVQVGNTDQQDVDLNGRGDACDDFDRDGVMQLTDNCPNLTNRGQEDVDVDGIGDVCDGEESRFTEKYAWVPWVGMGMAALVIGVLFFLVATAPKKEESAVVEEQK